MTVLLWAVAIFVSGCLAALGAAAATILVRALRYTAEIARLPAAVDKLSEAVDSLATIPPRLARLEAVVFPNGVPA